MKYLLLMLMIPGISYGLELETQNFIVKIESACIEGEVSCDNYTYTGTSKKSGKSIELKGSSWHSMCSDGETPCRFLGYKFKNRNVTYFVTEDGLLEVVLNKDEVILSERGKWK